jgi:hypothetical protein
MTTVRITSGELSNHQNELLDLAIRADHWRTQFGLTRPSQRNDKAQRLVALAEWDALTNLRSPPLHPALIGLAAPDGGQDIRRQS